MPSTWRIKTIRETRTDEEWRGKPFRLLLVDQLQTAHPDYEAGKVVRAELQTAAVRLAEDVGDMRGIVTTGGNKKVVVEVEGRVVGGRGIDSTSVSLGSARPVSAQARSKIKIK